MALGVPTGNPWPDNWKVYPNCYIYAPEIVPSSNGIVQIGGGNYSLSYVMIVRQVDARRIRRSGRRSPDRSVLTRIWATCEKRRPRSHRPHRRPRALDQPAARGAGAVRVGAAALQIYNGGNMPTSAGYFFLGNPVTFTGREIEGESDAGTADTSTSVPVLVIGSKIPNVGDILPAYAVGGRWVAEMGAQGSGTPSLPCSPSPIPQENLTISWVNTLLGNGSTTLTYSYSGSSYLWESGCSDGLIYQLFCSGGVIQFNVIFFVSGSCPDGGTGFCSNARPSPFNLSQASYSSSPFSLVFTETDVSCPDVAGVGFQSWTITT